MSLFKTDVLDAEMMVDDIPEVRQAREEVLRLEQLYTEANETARPHFKAGTATLSLVALELRAKAEAAANAVAAARATLQGIREREREHIVVARVSGAQRIRRESVPAVRTLKTQLEALRTYRAATGSLVGGWRGIENDLSYDEPLLAALSAWIETNQLEASL